MCGFLGGFYKKAKDETLVQSSLDLIQHRGPDHSSFYKYVVDGGWVYLGHTRLSIIDLTDSASQPFRSRCGGYVLIFNGEIYNYKEIKEELIDLGCSFETNSDTEVLLYALMIWGVECLSRLIGMFSFVFYEQQQEKLLLVRDAFGIKPLFYSINDGEITFGSEIRALLSLKNEKARPNLQRAYDYLVHGDYDSTQESFVDGVFHLSPAHYFTFDLKTKTASKPERWWQPVISTNNNISFDDAVSQLRTLFLDSVRLHLRSDVPLGVALSGGIDSSAVVSTIRYLEPSLPIKTFSYIASDSRISEEKWVDLLNEKIGAIAHKVVANQDEMREDLDAMLLMQGEPFGGTSIYAQYRVFKLAKESGVKVTLDGQGADELLAGYSGYPGHRLLSIIERQGWLAAHRYAKRWSKSPGRSYALAWQYLGRIILPDSLYELARKKMGRDFQPAWLNIDYLRQRDVEFKEKRATLKQENKGVRVKEALANSLTGRGLSSLLRHGDRNSMAFSIESRVPFLTLPLAEFLLSLPENYLVSDDGMTKHVFREAMRGIMPDSHLDRKDKIGFATPESTWLLNMVDVMKEWISDAPELPFLDKSELLKEFQQVVEGSKSFDGRVWRWVNYLRWCTLMGVE
ncbi:TPA: asparagine synthase (glutamine-hydrolyzing) [Vibrio cholerae]|uniref:asparagine synthase (glutamine-hydrolyzing) n=1 Tax=Vibrio cholerae TaxID=666 RepID=D6NM15_VIBCL|nr:asparagine synthetase [Vibrio cholerae]EGQ8224089.1 asparagine synthase (glutamine-hydrolyzing) [Vibrio cholerae]HDI3196802.1 asparagine synthase (glutamine-hydrolyzing) [Vibrio cholerae]HDI3249753.1 asparagine synthase (glutamine-hydrolyzing) [Vibrio cholerae]HDZ3695922.1 asparagine synthase (glutamine-hydrolyzing) [Vibrio cholerae]